MQPQFAIYIVSATKKYVPLPDEVAWALGKSPVRRQVTPGNIHESRRPASSMARLPALHAFNSAAETAR